MSDATATVSGNLVSDPTFRVTRDGVPVANFRIASTPRRYDRVSGQWRDGETSFITIICWRMLGEHVSTSLRKGDAVVVTGRLAVREYDGREGDRRISVEIEATSVGPDLNRCNALVTRVRREQTTAAAAQSSDQDANYHAGHPGGAVDEVDDSIEGPADDEVAA